MRFSGSATHEQEHTRSRDCDDPYDTTDHNQDGYGVYPAERFIYNFTFYNFFDEESGELNDMCFLVATPIAE